MNTGERRESCIHIPIYYLAKAMENKLVFDFPEMKLLRFYVDHAHENLVLVVECDMFVKRFINGPIGLYICSFTEEDGKTVVRLNLGK